MKKLITILFLFFINSLQSKEVIHQNTAVVTIDSISVNYAEKIEVTAYYRINSELPKGTKINLPVFVDTVRYANYYYTIANEDQFSYGYTFDYPQLDNFTITAVVSSYSCNDTMYLYNDSIFYKTLKLKNK
jgi:hypothetical protein